MLAIGTQPHFAVVGVVKEHAPGDQIGLLCGGTFRNPRRGA
jgi:hypothetical protein